MRYLESVIQRIPDRFIESLSSVSLELSIGSRDVAYVIFVDSNKEFKGIAFDIILDGIDYYAWPRNVVCFSAEQLIAVGQLLATINDIAHEDFMQTSPEEESLNGKD